MRGYKMVRAIMAEYGMGEKEFFQPKRQESIVARVDAMHRLKAAGYNKADIARALHIHYDTVRYWLSPALRTHKLGLSRRRNLVRRTMEAPAVELRA